MNVEENKEVKTNSDNNKDFMQCGNCKEIFIDVDKFLLHKKNTCNKEIVENTEKTLETSTTRTKSGEEEEVSLIPNKYTFKCKKCLNYKTRFKTHIIEHMLKEHEINLLECPECKKIFKDEWKLRRHLDSTREHDRMINIKNFNDLIKDYVEISLFKAEFKCPKCDLIFHTYNLFGEHLKETHEDCKLNKIHMCKDCGSIFRTKYKLNMHVLNIHTKVVVTKREKKRLIEEQVDDTELETIKRVKVSHSDCPQCKKKYTNQDQFEKHMQIHELWIKDDDQNHEQESNFIDDEYQNKKSSIYSYECVYCKIYFKTNLILIKHKEEYHKLRRVYACCNVNYDNLKDFIEHGKEIHSNKTHKCTKCGQVFENKNQLKSHNRTHQLNSSTKKPLMVTCTQCKLKFISKEELDNHLKETAHKYTCYTCFKEFDTQNSLHNHLATHQDLLLFVCDICMQPFKTRNDLSRHASTHNDNISKNRTCKICLMTFKTSFHLKRHELTRHTDARPFKCDICEMTFARKDKLKQHEAKHVDRPIFSCNQCGKGFYRKEHLKDHEITRHTKQYPFECENCKKGFVHSKDLHRHIRVRHLGMSDTSTLELEQHEQQTVVVNNNQIVWPNHPALQNNQINIYLNNE